MPIKPSDRLLTNVIESLVPSDSKRLILRSIDGKVFYLLANERLICWSEDYAEIEEAFHGRFPGVSPTKAPAKVSAAEAARLRAIAARCERLNNRLVSMLNHPDQSVARQRLVEWRVLQQRYGIVDVRALTNPRDYKAVSKLLGSWTMRSHAMGERA